MNPFVNKSGDELAAMWQLRALYITAKTEPKLFRILTRVLANEYTAVTENTWRVILKTILDIDDLERPILLGYARTESSGRVTSVIVSRSGRHSREVVYESKDGYLADLRKLADALKFNDGDRVDFFATMGKWITRDDRIRLVS